MWRREKKYEKRAIAEKKEEIRRVVKGREITRIHTHTNRKKYRTKKIRHR